MGAEGVQRPADLRVPCGWRQVRHIGAVLAVGREGPSVPITQRLVPPRTEPTSTDPAGASRTGSAPAAWARRGHGRSGWPRRRRRARGPQPGRAPTGVGAAPRDEPACTEENLGARPSFSPRLSSRCPRCCTTLHSSWWPAHALAFKHDGPWRHRWVGCSRVSVAGWCSTRPATSSTAAEGCSASPAASRANRCTLVTKRSASARSCWADNVHCSLLPAGEEHPVVVLHQPVQVARGVVHLEELPVVVHGLVVEHQTPLGAEPPAVGRHPGGLQRLQRPIHHQSAEVVEPA